MVKPIFKLSRNDLEEYAHHLRLENKNLRDCLFKLKIQIGTVIDKRGKVR